MLRVRHEAHHIAPLVADSRHVADGTVRAAALVAQDDLVVPLELLDELGRGEPAALTVLDGDHEPLASLAP